MITLYTWSTPNGRKISIMLEECGLPYAVRAIDITKGEQHTAAFLAVNPNAKIPALIDSDGPDGAPITLFESGAILIYLASKWGNSATRSPGAKNGISSARRCASNGSAVTTTIGAEPLARACATCASSSASPEPGGIGSVVRLPGARAGGSIGSNVGRPGAVVTGSIRGHRVASRRAEAILESL